MRPLFILKKLEHYRSDDPNWRSIIIQKGYDTFHLLSRWNRPIVPDYRIRIPLLRKLDE